MAGLEAIYMAKDWNLKNCKSESARQVTVLGENMKGMEDLTLNKLLHDLSIRLDK